MSSPVIINPGVHFPGYNFGDSAMGQHCFQHGPNLYLVLFETGNFDTVPTYAIQIFKSTDQGVTWAGIDSANSPVIDPGVGAANMPNYSACLDSSTLWVLAITGSKQSVTGCGSIWIPNGTILFSFDCGSDTWTNHAGTQPTSDIVPGRAVLFPGNQCVRTNLIQLTKRPVINDFIVLYAGPEETIAGNVYARTWMVTFDPAIPSYGTPQELPAQTSHTYGAVPVGLAYSSSGLGVIVYQTSKSTPNEFCIFALGLATDNTFGTTQLITDLLDIPGQWFVSLPIVWTDSGSVERIAIAGLFYDDLNVNECVSVLTAPLTLNPVFTKTDIVSADYGDNFANVVPYNAAGNYYVSRLFSCAYTAGAFTIFWGYSVALNLNPSPANYYSTSTTVNDLSSGWAAPASVFLPPAESFTLAPKQTFLLVSSFGLAFVANSVQQTPNTALAEITQFFLIGSAPPLAASCNNPPSGMVGTAYDHVLAASGGTAPYTFAVTGGALPPGLSLDSSTGDISGTPVTAGIYPFAVTVTDSASATVTINCSVIIVSRLITFRWDRSVEGWFPQRWMPGVTSVYSEIMPAATSPRLLMTTDSGSILTTGGTTDDGLPIPMIVRTPSFDGGDPRSQKLYVDVMTDLINQSPGTITVGYDNYTNLLTPVATGANAGRSQIRLTISLIAGSLALYRNIALEYAMSGGTRLFESEPAGYLQPYLSDSFISRHDAGFPDWVTFRDCLIALISTADVTLTIDIDGSTALSPYTLTSTSGNLRKVYQLLRHASKGRMFIWQLRSTQPFALFADETIFRMKSWTGDLIDVKPFAEALP